MTKLPDNKARDGGEIGAVPQFLKALKVAWAVRSPRNNPAKPL
jgi:hypothetical protein